MPTFGSLFAGIGGIDLGLERAGWTGRWQVEYEPYCQRVLAKHWPAVARYGDVHDVHGEGACPLADTYDVGRLGIGGVLDGIGPALRDHADRRGRSGLRCPNCLPTVDLIAGGFPCQPFSNAGKRQGKDDIRWLWPEFARVIGDLRPRYVLVENVPGLLAGHGGMGSVLGDLAALGYDAEWDSIPASAVGAPHLRYRVWIVATRVAHTDGIGPRRQAEVGQASLSGARPEGAGAEPHGAGARAMADADQQGPQGHRGLDLFGEGAGEWLARARGRAFDEQWSVEPDVGRVAHGVPARVDRLRALGNAVVPQVVEAIGRRILEADALT